MRRTTAAVFGTVIGTVLLTGLKLGTDAPATNANVTADGPAPTTVPDGNAGQPDDNNDPSALPSQGPGRRHSAKRRTKSPTARPKTTATKNSSGLKNGTFAGAASSNKYGTIKVTITVSGGRISAVSASYPTSPSHTGHINQQAIPKLKQEALAAQSANVSTVSGATYTSNSFRSSLRSALTAARN